MEIEKISDNQIKFVLSKIDLQKRDIKIGELAYGSEKTQELFRDMMTEAMIKFDFHTENIPLMIEAIPVSSDSIIILVTKVTNPDDIEERFNYFNSNKDKPIEKIVAKSETKKLPVRAEFILIYSFENLNTISKASSTIYKYFSGDSSVYKYKERFYLVLEHQDTKNKKAILKLESILSEYGIKHISTKMSKYYLIEHGEKFIKSNAIEILKKYLG